MLGRLRKDGTRKEILTCKNKDGYHMCPPSAYPESSRHRIVWAVVNGPIPDGMWINHINHVPGDDRIGNLELVTSQQNSAYRKKGNNKLYKGVYRHSSGSAFCAQIGCGGGSSAVYIGRFATAEEAARAYDAAAREWYGRHAVLNFPDGSPT